MNTEKEDITKQSIRLFGIPLAIFVAGLGALLAPAQWIYG
jgi:hypothetical protein